MAAKNPSAFHSHIRAAYHHLLRVNLRRLSGVAVFPHPFLRAVEGSHLLEPDAADVEPLGLIPLVFEGHPSSGGIRYFDQHPVRRPVANGRPVSAIAASGMVLVSVENRVQPFGDLACEDTFSHRPPVKAEEVAVACLEDIFYRGKHIPFVVFEFIPALRGVVETGQHPSSVEILCLGHLRRWPVVRVVKGHGLQSLTAGVQDADALEPVGLEGGMGVGIFQKNPVAVPRYGLEEGLAVKHQVIGLGGLHHIPVNRMSLVVMCAHRTGDHAL
ncbi:MAG: hypothetical protein NC095_07675 [Muribaculum sp.]|nr:hypothetical protein [Muribaculum sp.]